MRKIRQNPTPQRVPVIERVILLLISFVTIGIVPSTIIGIINNTPDQKIYCFFNLLLSQRNNGIQKETEAKREKHLAHSPMFESHIQKHLEGI